MKTPNYNLTSLGLSQLLDQCHGLAGKSSLNSPSGTGVDDCQKLLLREVDESLHLKTSVSELLKLSLLAKSGDSLHVYFLIVSHYRLGLQK